MTTKQQPQPIVVGVDGTKDAEDAARWAAGLALWQGEPLRLVHAMTSVDEALLVATAPEATEDVGEYPRALGHAVLQHAADAVHADHPDLRLLRTLSHGDPADALIEQSRHARMVVTACADVSAAGAVLVGSTTLAVATNAACPVIAWRGQAVSPNDRPVVVGVDEDHLSQEALVTAFELADCLGVGLTAVNVMSARRSVGEVDIPYLVDWEALKDEARERLVDIVALVAHRWPNVAVSYVVEMGRASRVIVDLSASAQLVVVGSRGRGAVASALLGSTGLGLLHHSRVPIVICPATKAPAVSAGRHAAAGSVVSPKG